MSWSVSGYVEDGDTSELEANVARMNGTYAGGVNDSMQEQQEFCLNTIHEAFDAGVVEGVYSVAISGHSNPAQENDRKSLYISMSATMRPVANVNTPDTPVAAVDENAGTE